MVQRLCKNKQTLIFFAIVSVLTIFIGTSQAYADEYSIPHVSIQAVVEQDGTLEVTEDRSFDFDGSFNGVFWDIPQGKQKGIDTKVELISAGEVNSSGVYKEFNKTQSAHAGDKAKYSTETTTKNGSSVLHITLYNPQYDNLATYRIVYRLKGAVLAYSDTAELYWKFVSDGWEVNSEDITCSISINVPKNITPQPGEVKAWAHGPLNGTVQPTLTGAEFEVPRVDSSDFAEARMTFPSSWVPKESVIDKSRLNTILEEEQAWADQANKQRVKARFEIYGITALFVISTIISVAVVAHLFKTYKASHKPMFTGEYFRDVPTKDHPALFSLLVDTNALSSSDAFAASVVRLSDKGCFSLQKIQRKALFGRIKESYALNNFKWDINLAPSNIDSAENPEAEQSAARIDAATLDFLKNVAFKQAAISNNESEDMLYFDLMDDIAKEYSEEYMEWVSTWKGIVEAQKNARRFGTDEHKPFWVFSKVSPVLVWVKISVAFFLLVNLSEEDAVIASEIIGVCLVFLIVSVIFFNRYKKKCVPISAEALEIKAKLEALKKWLCEFTLLEEAPPTDVIVWNRLMVAAIALGVADKAIKNLEIAAPEVLQNPDFYPTYLWCYGFHSGMHSPLQAFAATTDNAVKAAGTELSKQEIAQSSFSSGSGAGGGFSSGGGGGIGGGGGGGAF